jgi:cysteine desulfurase
MLPSGVIDLVALELAPHEAGEALVATSWVNGETGVIQPVDEIAAVAKENGARLLLDAAQAARATSGSPRAAEKGRRGSKATE